MSEVSTMRPRRAARAAGHPDASVRALLDALPAAAYTCDAAGLITYFNARAAEVWGRTPRLHDPQERFCGSFRLYSVDGQPIAHADCWMARALRNGGASPSGEIVIERPDGQRRRVLAHISPLYDADGNLGGAVNVLADVTEMRRTEERLRVLLDGIADHFVQYDREWRYTFVNEKAEAVLGMPRDALLGRSIWELFPDAVGNDYYRLLHHAAATGEVVRFEHYYAPFDKWFDNNIYPTADGVSVFSTDITQRKQAERAIQEREARYRSLVHASGAIVFTSDAQAQWLEPQPSWEAYTGQSFDQYRGLGWAAAIHPDDRARITASVAAAVAAGTVWSVEGRLWHAPSQSYRHQEARAVPIRGADGAVSEWVGTCLDIHARKTAEHALREADRRKEEFLAVLAHELRNPLAPIATSLQMLRMQGAGGAAAPMVEVMERQVHHLVRLVDDLLEVSRITRGTIELRRDVFPLQDAVRGAVEISEDLVAAHAHALTLEAPSEPLWVDGDRVRLTQVVSNLLNNAAKYTPRGGSIRVRVERAGGEARVVVADSGIGIAPEQIERVFEMFAQTGRSIERATGGLGIGLSLARRLAELHGGTVEGRSDGEGRGSEFTVRLPVAAPARAATTAAESAPAAAGHRRNVLVVDDNRDAATMLVALLESLGHEARASFSGAEALQLAAAAPPEVMLLDLGMPDTDGYMVARRVRESAWGARTRLIAITGWGQESDRRRTSEAGFDLHLVKPIALDELRRALD